MNTYVPVTPAGSVLMHLEADTEDEAWDKLVTDTSHMPYRDKEALVTRGYTIYKMGDLVDEPA